MLKQAVTMGVLGTSMLVAPCMAEAQPSRPDRWYVAGQISYSILKDARTEIANAPMPGATIVTRQMFDGGFGGSLAAGREVGPARLEAEIGYASNDAEEYRTVSPFQNEVRTDTRMRSRRLMVNGYFDIGRGAIRPYVGAGVGAAKIKFRVFAPRAPFPTEAPRELIDDSDSKAAYQLMAGAALGLAPQLAITGQYRWFDAGKIKGEDSRGERFTAPYRGHNIDVGLRLSF